MIKSKKTNIEKDRYVGHIYFPPMNGNDLTISKFFKIGNGRISKINDYLNDDSN
jgi:hypothetical protein